MILTPLEIQWRQDSVHALDEKRIVAFTRPVALALLGEGDGTLGQTFEDEVIKVAEARQLNGWIDPVAGVSGP